ncbi:MAG: oligosaccharide flippase family protein [Candidatus Bathyarchaeota archaeon]|nr:oligosaccharide flippase family protein [Candidatus Bathyarchaeota archaeon]
MEKALKMGRVSATGSFHMFIGVATSTIIMAVGTIIMARILLPEEYGLYSVALTPSLMIGLFRDWGMGAAMTKYVAHFRAANKESDIRGIVAAGIMFEVSTGLVLSFVSLFLASFIATTVFHRQQSTDLISIASITILAGSLLTASQSSFIGFERMGLNSFTIICQAIAKTAISPLLVLLGYGALGAVLGYTFSFIAAGVIGLTMLYFLLFRNLRKTGNNRISLSETLKTMLRYGVPLSISSIVLGFLAQFYGFMMASFCSDSMIGNYKVAAQFSVLLSFFTIPIATVLFPAFAKLDPQKEHRLLKTVFTSSVKYTAILLVPATMAIMVLSKPMISTLFGDKWVYAPIFLALSIISNLLVIFGSLVSGNLLTGLGETKMLMKLGILTLSLGVPLAFLLIPTLGITGVILGIIFAGIPSTFYGLYWIWKKYDVKADFKSSARIFLASGIAAITTYTLLNFVILAEWIRLIIGLVIFLATYIFTAPMVEAITQSDIDNLRTMLSGLGVISKITNFILILPEKISNLRTHTKKNTQS